MKHDEIVKHAERWLRKHRQPTYPIVLSDVRCMAVSEQPDVIGWTTFGMTLLIECKASKADFTRDATKSFRRCPEQGMGLHRFYCAPAGMLAASALPERWGLLEVDAGGRVTMSVPSGTFEHNVIGHRHEQTLLVSALKRATEGWGRRMFGDEAPAAADGDAHPTTAKIIRQLRDENTRLHARLRGAS